MSRQINVRTLADQYPAGEVIFQAGEYAQDHVQDHKGETAFCQITGSAGWQDIALTENVSKQGGVNSEDCA